MGNNKNIITYIIGLTLISGLTEPNVSRSSEIDKNLEYTKVVQGIQPRLTRKEARIIASSIIDVANRKECKIPAITLLSIAFKESSLNKGSYNKITKDFGLMQINVKMINAMHLNKSRLLRDVKYNIAAGCEILTYNKTKFSKKRNYWVGIYNSGTKFSSAKVVKRARSYSSDIKLLTIHINEQYNKTRFEE